ALLLQRFRASRRALRSNVIIYRWVPDLGAGVAPGLPGIRLLPDGFERLLAPAFAPPALFPIPLLLPAPMPVVDAPPVEVPVPIPAPPAAEPPAAPPAPPPAPPPPPPPPPAA